MLLLVKKNIAEGQDRRNFKSVRTLFVFFPRVSILNFCYDFALVLHENALVFSQLESRNFFVYIIHKVIYLLHLPRLYSFEMICMNEYKAHFYALFSLKKSFMYRNISTHIYI